MTQDSRLPDGPILLIRMDRIGDLVLTLPCDASFGLRDDGSARADWWVAPGLGFIADHASPRRRVREVKSKIGWNDFWALVKEVKRRQYAAAVIFHAPWWVSALTAFARIPLRIAVKSQWHTFIFANKGVRQKRSLAEFSELEYNYRLIEQGFGLDENSIERETLKLSVSEAWSTATLARHGLAANEYSVVHPGMGGSARNWSATQYVAWLQEAAEQGPIVITGTASDATYLDPIRQALGGAKNLFWLDGKITGPELLQILAHAKRVLAPSTGIAHLTASLERPLIGIYSPVRVQHPRRWGPLGDTVQVLVPEVDCPGKKSCLGPQCSQYDCMSKISSETIRPLWSALDMT